MSKPAADTNTPDAPPAYFLSLTVENFRCFKQSVTLDLSDGNGKPAMWNVLLGENGVGKTTLLQCIVSLTPLQERSSEYDRPTEYIQYMPSAGTLHRPAYFGEFYKNVPLFARFGTSASVKIDSQHDTDEESVSVLGFSYGKNRDTPFFWSSGYKVDERERLNVFTNAYGATRRMGKRALSETASSDPCASLFDDTAELINAEEWLLQANYAAQTATGGAKKRAEKRLAQVIDLVCGILPDGGVTDIRFTLDESTAVMTPRVEAHTPFGWVRLRDLSLGYQAALTWMVDLAARLLERYPNSANPLAEPAIVLVDEIDLHLHPKWQRELITKLRTTFPRTQFIVTAHSPLIVQAAPDANIALLRRVGDHVEIANDVDHVRNWRVDQILTSDVFGLDGAYPEYTQEKMQERSRIATKARLTAADRKRIEVLDAEIEALPVGENVQAEERINDVLRRAAAMIEGNRK